MKTLTEFKNQNIKEDGHTDVPSAMRSLKVMSESISEIEAEKVFPFESIDAEETVASEEEIVKPPSDPDANKPYFLKLC